MKTTYLGSEFSPIADNPNKGMFEQVSKFDYPYEKVGNKVKLKIAISYREEEIGGNINVELINSKTTILIEPEGKITADALYSICQSSVEELNHYLTVVVAASDNPPPKTVCPSREAMDDDLYELGEELNNLMGL